MRKQQLTLNGMRKHMILVNQGKGGKKGQGPLIVMPGGRVQVKDRLKVAEETWGGLRVVDAEDLPKFGKQQMSPIT
eukprot:2209721-Heterocapsa_arctica.AAC.1